MPNRLKIMFNAAYKRAVLSFPKCSMKIKRVGGDVLSRSRTAYIKHIILLIGREKTTEYPEMRN